MHVFLGASCLKVKVVKSRVMCSRFVLNEKKQVVNDIFSIEFIVDLKTFCRFILPKMESIKMSIGKS
ncbi:hypothetical protein TSUD_373910 [Trifolium subterraneum]|uniref:Uncharacterized protein n=1 Tax=Trifolium subterraneum TaxID=3900 RepID=A0A2Z6MW82_TRISU|nr:hypothetical protein TSUD_373910 [Trifolium subterraneum]